MMRTMRGRGTGDGGHRKYSDLRMRVGKVQELHGGTVVDRQLTVQREEEEHN